jgi:hypothetical protein
MDENNNLIKEDWSKPEISVLNVNNSLGGNANGTESGETSPANS